MSRDDRRPFASLAMYPFDELRDGYDALWAAIQQRAPRLPPRLDWKIDLHTSWRSADMVVSQTCGWPLVTQLGRSVRVVGAFTHPVPGAIDHRYASVIIASRRGALQSFTHDVAAVNGDDSLSGWISLRDAFGEAAAAVGPVLFTGSHLASVRAIHEGRATVASIDAVSLAHIERLYPHLMEGIVRIGSGPLVPSLPVIAGSSTTDEQLQELRSAFSAAVADPPLRSVTEMLLIDGFVALDFDDYEPLLDLEDRVGR